MLAYTLRRMVGLVPTLFVLATLAFFIIRLAPGGPFDQEQALTPAVRARRPPGPAARVRTRDFAGRGGRRLGAISRQPQRESPEATMSITENGCAPGPPFAAARRAMEEAGEVVVSR